MKSPIKDGAVSQGSFPANHDHSVFCKDIVVLPLAVPDDFVFEAPQVRGRRLLFFLSLQDQS